MSRKKDEGDLLLRVRHVKKSTVKNDADLLLRVSSYRFASFLLYSYCLVLLLATGLRYSLLYKTKADKISKSRRMKHIYVLGLIDSVSLFYQS